MSKKRPVPQEVAGEPTTIKRICDEVKRTPAKEKGTFMEKRLIKNVKEQAAAIAEIFAQYDSDSSDDAKEILVQVAKKVLGMESAPMGRKLSSLNTAKNLREAASYFDLKFRSYQAKELSYEVPEALQQYLQLVRHTDCLDNEAARRKIVDPVLTYVASRIEKRVVLTETSLQGTVQTVEGPFLCRGRQDYAVAQYDENLTDRKLERELRSGCIKNIITSTPLTVEAKKLDIVKHCNEQFIAEMQISESPFGILTNGFEWTFVSIQDGVLNAVMEVSLLDDLESVAAYADLFMRSQHLPPADGVWPRPEPVNPKDEFRPASNLHTPPSPSEQYLGLHSPLPYAELKTTVPSATSITSVSPVGSGSGLKFDTNVSPVDKAPSTNNATKKVAPKKAAPKKAAPKKAAPKKAAPKKTSKKSAAKPDAHTDFERKRKDVDDDDDYSGDSEEGVTLKKVRPPKSKKRSAQQQ